MIRKTTGCALVALAAVVAACVPGPAVSEPTPGTGLQATPSTTLATIDQANAGDTVTFTTGSYPKLVLRKSFSSGRVTVKCQSGAVIAGVDSNGMSGYTFDGCRVSIPVEYTDISKRAVEIQGPSSNITWQNATITGGFIGWDIYGSSGQWAKNIRLVDSDVSLSGGDLIHTNGVDGLLIEHNNLHDPSHNASLGSASEHHDGWQPQNTTNATFTRNHVWWTSGTGHYTGTTGSYLGQGIMISGDDGAVQNVVISNNLIEHYNGRPIDMVDAVGVKVVNNTLLDAGDGIGITVNVGSSAVEVWNNITTCVYGQGGQTTYVANNWLINNAPCGGAAIDGESAYHGDPALAPDYRPTASSPVKGKGSTRTGTPTIDLDGATRSTPVLGARIG